MSQNKNARFGLIPLPLAKFDTSVQGELLMNPNDAHIYANRQGVAISKTLELEERLNIMERILKATTNGISIYGKEILAFFPDIKDTFNVASDTGGTIRITRKNGGATKAKIYMDKNMFNCYFDPACDNFVSCTNYGTGKITSIGAVSGSDALVGKGLVDAFRSNTNEWRTTGTRLATKIMTNASNDNRALFYIEIEVPSSKSLTIASITVQKLPTIISDNSMNNTALFIDKYNKTALKVNDSLDANGKVANIVIPRGKLLGGEYSMIITCSGVGSLAINMGYNNPSHTANLSDYSAKGNIKSIALSMNVIETSDGNIAITKKPSGSSIPTIHSISITRRDVAQFSDNR